MSEFSFNQRLFSEWLSTSMLLIVVVGSGIMGETLSPDNSAVALLANSLATGAGLYFLISVFGPISGAHMNPAVSLTLWFHKKLQTKDLFGYVGVQILGGVVGVLFTHLMFDLPILQFSGHDRTGIGQWSSEAFATFGLLITIYSFALRSPAAIPAAVGIYITGAYWFTSSTSFANPAVTVARMFSDTFAGINPVDVLAFILAQVLGVVLFVMAWKWLEVPAPRRDLEQAEPQYEGSPAS